MKKKSKRPFLKSKKPGQDFSEKVTGNDMAVIESGFPPMFISIVTQIAMTMGSALCLRVGNAPRIGFGHDAKPMTVKQKTSSVFLYKSLIPIDRYYLASNSNEFLLGSIFDFCTQSELLENFEDIVSNYEEHVRKSFLLLEDTSHERKRSVIKNFGVSQLRVSLYEILIDSDSYLPITTSNLRGSELLLYPKPSVVKENPGCCKRHDIVLNTVFIIDLKDTKALGISKSKLFEERPSIRHQLKEISEPDWWSNRLGDFAVLTHQSFPVYYAQKDQDNICEPFLILGGANAAAAKGRQQQPLTGDVDLFWITPFVSSYIYDEKYKFIVEGEEIGPLTPFEIGEPNTEKSAVLKKITLSLLSDIHEKMGLRLTDIFALAIRRNSLEDVVGIQGLSTPSEITMIYMINTLFGAEDIQISQLVLHGSEVFNPGEPSKIERLLHILPDGERVLTHNEDELVWLLLQDDFLNIYPVQIHPKWNIEQWAPVIERKKSLGQKISPETTEAYESYIELNNALSNKIFRSSNLDYLIQHANEIDYRWDMNKWGPIIKKILEKNPKASLSKKTYAQYQNQEQYRKSQLSDRHSASLVLGRSRSYSSPKLPSFQLRSSCNTGQDGHSRRKSQTSSPEAIRRLSSSFYEFNTADKLYQEKSNDQNPDDELSTDATLQKIEKPDSSDLYDELNSRAARFGTSK